MAKNLVFDPILAHLAKIWDSFFFFKNLALPVTKHFSQLSSCSCTLLKKTNDPILGNSVTDTQMDRWPAGQTDRYMDGQLVQSDFVGHCPTNIECTRNLDVIARHWSHPISGISL